jgi:hypothetical protein
MDSPIELVAVDRTRIPLWTNLRVPKLSVPRYGRISRRDAARDSTEHVLANDEPLATLSAAIAGVANLRCCRQQVRIETLGKRTHTDVTTKAQVRQSRRRSTSRRLGTKCANRACRAE